MEEEFVPTAKFIEELDWILRYSTKTDNTDEDHSRAGEWLTKNGYDACGWAKAVLDDPSASEKDRQRAVQWDSTEWGSWGDDREFWDEYDEIDEIEDEEERARRMEEFWNRED